MKTVRQLCAAFVLTMALGLSAFAGNMSTTVVDPPPPPSIAEGNMSTTVAGNMTTGSGEAIDSGTEITLSILQSLLSLF